MRNYRDIITPEQLGYAQADTGTLKWEKLFNQIEQIDINATENYRTRASIELLQRVFKSSAVMHAKENDE
jgi:hypothetical protein